MTKTPTAEARRAQAQKVEAQKAEEETEAGSGSPAGAASGQAPVMPEKPVKENPHLSELGGREEWERFLSQVREAKLTLGIWLMSAEVAGIENGSLILSFTSQNKFAMEMIREVRNRRLIETHLEKFYGRKFTVEACENVKIDAVCTAGPQAELAMQARTSPKRGGGREDQPAGPGTVQIEAGALTDIDNAESGKAGKGKKGGKSSAGGKKAGGRGRRAADVDNPTLRKIMEGLDAELLD